MVGRLYWASCARATGIDALLRRSPPASCDRLYPAAAGRRILAGDRLYPASRRGYRRSAASLSPCCAAANIRRQQSDRFRRLAGYTGGDKPCAGSGYRRSAAPFSPRVVRSPIFGDSSPTNFGGRLAILGKLCVDNGRRRSAAPLSLHRSVANIRRQRSNGRALHRALPLSYAIAKAA